MKKAYPVWPNLPTMMFDRARLWGERPMLRSFHEGAWHSLSWAAFARRTAAFARGLHAAGIAPGERVVIASENRPEYVMAEVALMALGAVPVPVYTSNTLEDHAHILRDAGARAAIVSNHAIAARVLRAGSLDLLVAMDPIAEEDLARGVTIRMFGDLARGGADFADVADRAAAIPPSALACLIYTSGTGGTPRGVMLPHRSILANCRGAEALVRPLRLTGAVYLSFLPAAHSYEHTVGQFFLPSIGVEVVYARGIEHLSADMLTVRPTIMTMVPRVLEVIRARILGHVAHQARWKRILFARGLAAGLARTEGRALGLGDRLLDPVYERLVRRRVLARFGGELVAAMSGGARLEPEVGRFFQALGIELMQGYGQTEAGPVIAANPPGAVRIDTVGRPLEGVEVRIAQDGEILVRGDLVMDGYWMMPEETRAVLHDGWLHTGDIGEMDGDGYLRITDRKKDMIVLSGGENVSPARIEGMLVAEPPVAQAVVLGEGQAGLAALLVASDGFDAVAVGQAVAAVNQRLSATERIRRYEIVPPFTIDNGMLTATQKVRRHIVTRAHAGRLEPVAR